MTMSPGVRREAIRLIAESTPPHVARLEAAMIRDPALARFCRDLKLEAGAGSRDGQYTVAEIDRKLDEASRQYPGQYGDSAAKIAIKLKLLAAGAMSPKV
jgi:hypothetical protein